LETNKIKGAAKKKIERRRAAAEKNYTMVAFRFTSTTNGKQKCLPQAQHRHFGCAADVSRNITMTIIFRPLNFGAR